MPGESEHWDQAERNRQARASLSLTNFPEWVVTIAFYEALHLIEAVLAHHQESGPHCDHGTRHALLKTNARYQRVYGDYHKLFDASIWARYLDGASSPRSDARDPKLLYQAQSVWLYKIRQFAEQETGRSGASPAGAAGGTPPVASR